MTDKDRMSERIEAMEKQLTGKVVGTAVRVADDLDKAQVATAMTMTIIQAILLFHTDYSAMAAALSEYKTTVTDLAPG